MIEVRRDVLAADLGEEIVLLHPEDGSYFALNETGARLWRLLGDGPVAEDVVAVRVAGELAAGWTVDQPTAKADARALLAALVERGLVTRVRP
ncbi:PqqD family protein [Frankia sp. CH37]|nr:PqqD family protein [Parafrankia sp. CH37]